MGDFSHLDQSGKATMVDVSEKTATIRTAVVTGEVKISTACLNKLNAAAIEEIIHTARIAGIQATKKTSDLIPMCHQLNLNKADVQINLDKDHFIFVVRAMARTTGVTGVEMEAFTGAQIAALTIYDMIKAVNPEATIGNFKLIEKHGGKSGAWTRDDHA